MMNYLPFLIICPLTFLAGFVDSIAGGGGLISLPAFLLAGLPSHSAIATNKLSSCIGTTVSTIRYCKNGFFDKMLAIPTIILALIGSAIGAHMVLLIDDCYLKWMMVIVLPIVAIAVLFHKSDNTTVPDFPPKKRLIIACAGAFTIGMYDGFYGPGTGTFILLVLTALAHMDVRTASGNVKLINLSSNIAALTTFLFSGNVNIILGLTGASFCLCGHYIGSGMVMKGGNKVVKPIIILVLILLFIKVFSGH